MMRATSVVRRPAVKTEHLVDIVTLDHEERHRRRVALKGEGGLDFLLDLDRATVLDDGDAVKLDDGSLVRIRAAPERLIEIRTDNPVRLMRVAWHIGNRHVAAEIAADALYIGYDHVLLEMVRGLGATAREVERPFRPERGAYEGAHAHEHDDACGCGHDHGAHDHHAHDHGGHDHGGHDRHGHDHGHGGQRHGHGHSHSGHDHSHG